MRVCFFEAITVEQPVNDDIKYFAEKYGFHGTLCSMGRPNSPLALTEVMQLDFSSRYHRPKNYEPFPEGYDQAKIEKHAIPTDDETLLRWTHAICSNPTVAEAHYERARYNQPIGAKEWIVSDDPRYEALAKLPVLDYTW